jgi:prepilin-type N-terminal cleavage/methylation domain-containing protein
VSVQACERAGVRAYDRTTARPHDNTTARHGFTLIELLIVVAIVAILSGGLVFSATQIMTRSVVTQRTLLLEDTLSLALDALAADVARSTGHAVDGGTLALTLPRCGTDTPVCETPHLIDYLWSEGHLIRRTHLRDQTVETTLVTESASGELVAEPWGLRVSLTAGFDAWRRQVSRRIETSLAWPEAVGVSAP